MRNKIICVDFDIKINKNEMLQLFFKKRQNENCWFDNNSVNSRNNQLKINRSKW